MKTAALVLKNAVIHPHPDWDYFGADRGALLIIEAGLPLKGAVGDFDSVSEEERSQIEKAAEILIRLNCHKDQSDTAEALTLIKQLDYQKIIVLGGLSGRFDHTWANLQLLRRFPELVWEDEKNRLRILKPGSHEVVKEDYPYISFFSLEEGLITLEGMEYPLKEYWLHPLNSLGLSNVLLSKTGRVSCTMPVLCVQSRD